jgi:hypothetical protein
MEVGLGRVGEVGRLGRLDRLDRCTIEMYQMWSLNKNDISRGILWLDTQTSGVC